jgi:alpha-mannosidase
LVSCICFLKKETPEMSRLFSKTRYLCWIFLAIVPAALSLGPIRAFAGQQESEESAIHMIGHAHIDPVWRWTKDEGFAEVLATFRSAVARLQEHPEAAFVASSAQFYQWVKEADTSLFEQIKALVKEGRWDPVGGWWVEADVNCPLGESLVRQGLYGQRFFSENFGRKTEIGFNPDAFGHPWTLSQILSGQGLGCYFFMRPGPHEKRDLRTPLFLWQGPDGTKMPAVQILGSYNGSERSLEGQIEGTGRYFAQNQPDQKARVVFYGVGNHGGGPTRAAIEKIRSLREADPRIRFSTLDRYLATIRPGLNALPVVNDELQHHARGCYSACVSVKAWNRESEWALLTAEKLASLDSALLRTQYPTEPLRKSWEKVLFNQFHDILAGSAIEEAYRDARNDYGYALSAARDISIRSLQSIAQEVNTADVPSEMCAPFLVFNPQSWRAREPVEVELERLGNGPPRLARYDGKQLAYQEIRTAGLKVGSRIRFVFEDEFPSLGYALYYLDFSGTGPSPQSPGVKVEPQALENDFVLVSFDEKTGAIRSYFDKTTNRELLRAPASAIVLDDPDDTWGHGIVAYDREAGRFAAASFRTIETGPERGRIQVRTRYCDSALLQDYMLYASGPELHCRTTVNWNEYYKVLKIGIPTILNNGVLTYSIPYGFIERPMSGEEEPGQTWVDISGRDGQGKFGLALLNESKCGYSVKDGEIRLTVLHSTAWSHHVPAKTSESEGFRFMDTGVHEFSYALLPHQGDWRGADIARRAESFGMKPLVALTDRHPGPWEGRKEFLTVSSPHVSVTVLKMAEDGEALVLRLVELAGRQAEGEIKTVLADEPIPYRLRPCEIKTILLPLDRKSPPREVNLIEEPD